MPGALSFVLSVDTEEDNWESVRTGLSAENVRELPRFADFLARRGVRPTFFTTHEVARRPWAAGLLRDITAGGRGEIAAHVHPWNTPPFSGMPPSGGTMLCHYPVEAQAAKLGVLRDTLAEHTGLRPVSFRAGRFGAGRETILALIRTGFTVDSSVTPFHSWRRYDDGPDFVGAPTSVYRLDGRGDLRTPVADGPIIEVPLSAGYTRFALPRWPRIASLAHDRYARWFHLPGVAARAGLVQLTILSPEVAPIRHMVALTRRLVEGGASHLHLFLHSSSLRPGLTPFVTSRADLEHLYGALDRYLDALSGIAPVAFRTVAETAAAATCAPLATSTLPRRDVLPLVVAPPQACAPRRLLLVSYHFAPDVTGGASRWGRLTKNLARLGWDVHALTASGGADGHLREGVQVHVYPAGAVAAGAAPPLPGGGLWWGLGAGFEARRLVRRFRPEVVVTSGPPHAAHFSGFVATVGTGTSRVMDLYDVWTGRRADTSVSARLFWALLTPPLFRSARRVLASTAELAETLEELCPAVQVSVLNDAVDPEELPRGPTPPLPALSIATVGGLDRDREVKPVLRALRLFLERHPGAATTSRFRIAGPAPDEVLALLATQARDYGVEQQVEVLGSLPHAATLELLARSQVAVVLAQHQGPRVPVELYESCAARIPTVVLAERESATRWEALRLGADVREVADIEGIARTFIDAWNGIVPQRTAGTVASTEQSAAESLQSLLEIEGTTPAPPSDRAPAPSSSVESILSGERRVNWMWLADPPGWDRALDLTVGPSVLERALRLRFADVATLDCATAFAGAHGAARDESSPRLPYGDFTFDCVTIHGTWGELLRLAAAGGWSDLAMLRECRRVLRPGGFLYVAGNNPYYRRLFASAAGAGHHGLSKTMGAMRRAFLTAGFARVQGYYVSPSHRFPGIIIPSTYRAALEYERFSAGRSKQGHVRRILATLGLHRILHPSMAYLVYR